MGHMVKDHSDSERGNLLPPLYGATLSDLLYVHDSTNHGLCLH